MLLVGDSAAMVVHGHDTTQVGRPTGGGGPSVAGCLKSASSYERGRARRAPRPSSRLRGSAIRRQILRGETRDPPPPLSSAAHHAGGDVGPLPGRGARRACPAAGGRPPLRLLRGIAAGGGSIRRAHAKGGPRWAGGGGVGGWGEGAPPSSLAGQRPPASPFADSPAHARLPACLVRSPTDLSRLMWMPPPPAIRRAVWTP